MRDEEKVMPRMTEEEAWKLAEEVEKNPPKVSGDGKNGFFMKNKGNVFVVNDVSAAYLRTRADAVHKTPSEIIDELVRSEIVKEAVAV